MILSDSALDTKIAKLEFYGVTFARHGERNPTLVAAFHLIAPLLLGAFVVIGSINPSINLNLPSILASSTIRNWARVLPKHASTRIEAWSV